MNDQNTQKPNGAEAAPEGTGEPGLDELVKEFKDDAPKTPDLSKLLKTLEPLADYVQTDKEQKQKDAEQKTIDESISFLKGEEALKELDDDLALGFLNARYQKDTAFRSAHDNRGKDPEAWSKALESARENLTEKIKSLPGNTVRSDVEAAKAAVQGSSTKADEKEPSVDDMIGMSDAEFNRFKRSLDARR